MTLNDLKTISEGYKKKMKVLPINLDDLIHARSVESVRREFKKTWTEPIFEKVIRTICAFANDFYNLNGGYIILGVEELNGQPILPPHGLEDQNLEHIQKQIRGKCKHIDPEYPPVMSPEIYQGKQIMVIWVPGGELRPYQAPETFQKGSLKAYFIRQGSETVKAQGDNLTQLMQMTAKVPFDDRRNNSVPVEVISSSLVRKYLTDIRSDLVAPDVNLPDRDLYRYMKIVSPMNSHEAPRNVALLFFSEKPEQYFPGIQIEVVEFGDGAGGDLIEEKIFRGPIHFQLRQALDYLNSFSTSMIKKIPGRAEAHKAVAFPYEAMEEALVNAVYHRSYEIRRKMKENGSPEPEFEFDTGRTYFRVILPAHPQYVVIHALRNSAHLWATGDRKGAIANLEQALKKVPTSGAIISQLIEYKVSLGELTSAEHMFNENKGTPELIDRHLLFLAMARAYLDTQNPSKASQILQEAELLRIAIQISDDKVRTAWCWYDLARTLFWLNSPESEILNAYSKAMELLPDEPIFGLNYNKWKADSKKWGRY